MKNKLKDKDIRKAIKSLRLNNIKPKNGFIDLPQYFWIDHENWYLYSPDAKLYGFDCTKKEIDHAQSNGFIKEVRGIALYLTRYVAVTK